MNLPGLSIRRPVTIVMMIALIVMIGLVSLSKLEMDLLPNLNMPIAVATARYEGAGPREVETLVARPFEGYLSTVSNLESIETLSYDEYCLAILYFKNNTNMDLAALEMREKLDMAKTVLPGGVTDIMVMRIDPNQFNATMEIGVSSTLSFSDMTRLMKEQIISRLERIDGVATVSLAGGVEQEVQIALNEDQLKLYGLSEAQVGQLLGLENLDLPAGNIEASGQNIFIRTKGEFQVIDDIRNMILSTPRGSHVRLGDIATIDLVEKEKASESYINGKLSLSVSIQKQSNANTVMVCQAVNRELEKIKQQFQQLDFLVVYDSSRYILQAIRTVSTSALQGGLLAVVILYLFLRNIRATLIIALSIPVSVIATFVLMYFAGIKLNLLSLGGLALGVGMLVDNAIVVLENIYRHRSEGRSMKEAAEKGTREIMLAISASTLTSVVVFLPIVFIEGITGTIFKEMALTITFSLLSSLLIAITFIPMVASRILKLEYRLEGRRSLVTRLLDIWDKQYQRLYRGYKRLLCGCIKRKAATIGTASVIMALSLISAVVIGYEYFPSMDEGYITLEVSLPRGSSLSETHEIAMVVQDRLDEIPEIRSIVMNLGAGGFVLDRSTTENAVITAGIGKAGERKRSIKQISDDIRKEMKDIPGAIIEITDSGNVMGFSLGSNEVEIRLYGEDMDKLRSMSEDLSAMVKGIEGIRDVTCSVEEEALEAVIHINRSKAALYHLTTAQIADSVITAVNGSVATQYQYRGSQIDVRVSSGTMGTKSIEALKSVALKSALGVSIPLSEIAEIKIEKTPATILRNNQRRCVTITAGTNGRALNHITRDIEKRFKGYTFPSGYSYGFGGQQEELFRSFDDLALALVLAVFIVYMLLASQFESLLHPFTIMLTVPLSLTGGLIALLITGYTLSIPSFIGIIILVGIVVNNTIVLIDTINRLREEGHTREEAVLKAGPLRLRPILMTTLTTLLGMLPMALKKGDGSEIQSPLAVVVIGGLTIATFVTLLVIPSIYLVFDQWIGAFRTRKRRRTLKPLN